MQNARNTGVSAGAKNNAILIAETGHRKKDGINTSGTVTTLCPSCMLIFSCTEHRHVIPKIIFRESTIYSTLCKCTVWQSGTVG